MSLNLQPTTIHALYELANNILVQLTQEKCVPGRYSNAWTIIDARTTIFQATTAFYALDNNVSVRYAQKMVLENLKNKMQSYYSYSTEVDELTTLTATACRKDFNLALAQTNALLETMILLEKYNADDNPQYDISKDQNTYPILCQENNFLDIAEALAQQGISDTPISNVETQYVKLCGIIRHMVMYRINESPYRRTNVSLTEHSDDNTRSIMCAGKLLNIIARAQEKAAQSEAQTEEEVLHT